MLRITLLPCCLLTVASAWAEVPAPLTVLYGGVIHTVDDSRPRASAMVYSDTGEILAVGEDVSLREAYPQARHRDLNGATVIPGLIDAHGHLGNLASYFAQAQLHGSVDIPDIIRQLQEHERTLGENDWLLGRGWDQNDWPVTEFPTRGDLDRYFPDRPVLLVRIDGHASWANSAALAEADRELSGDWQPQGGLILRDLDGQPSGVFIDKARALIEDRLPPLSFELRDRLMTLALQRMSRLGLTGVHDAGASREEIEHYRSRIEQDRFPMRVYAMGDGAGPVLDWLCEVGGIDHPSGRLLARSAKLYADGALGSRGAALLRPYRDEPGSLGLLFQDHAALRMQASRVMDCGFQVAIHAIGDAGNRQALDVIEAAASTHLGDPGRHRIEHAQVLSGPDIARFAALGVIASMQPTHATSDMYWAEQRIGPERIRFAYAWRSLLDAGARLALGSDFPVEEVNPMHGISAAITRQDLEGRPEGGWYPAERLSRLEALRGFTLDAAYAAFMEHRVGSLEAGKRADFLVLDRDIMRIPADRVAATVVLETWLDGKRVYAAAGQP